MNITFKDKELIEHSICVLQQINTRSRRQLCKSIIELWENDLGPILSEFSLFEVPTALEGGWSGRGQGNFLSLGWEAILEDRWAISWPMAWRCGKETRILPYYFPLKNKKFYIKKEVEKEELFGHLNSILFHTPF